MNLEKLFGSKTKSDILKYLVFRRQGVSIRALESELWWTFPGIKKQIDSLEEAEVLQIDKTPEKRSINIMDDVYDEMRKLIVCSLKHDTIKILTWSEIIWKYYFGKVFDKPIDVDLVMLYDAKISDIKSDTEWIDSTVLEELKTKVTAVFKSHMIDPAYLVFMTTEEFDKRTKMADKFALQVIRSNQ